MAKGKHAKNGITAMLKARTCTLGIVTVALILTAMGATGRHGIYISYPYSFREEPILALPLMGLSDGVSFFGEKEYHVMRGAPSGETDEAPDNIYAVETAEQRLLQAGENENVPDLGVEMSGDRAAITAGENETGEVMQENLSADDPADTGTETGKQGTSEAGWVSLTGSSGTDAGDEIDASGRTAGGHARDLEKADEFFEEPEVYELTEVTDDYFTDALFLGDSRTVGLSMYCEELDERATFYAKTSLTIYGLLSKEFIKTEDGAINVETALGNEQYRKIYIMIGINELGTGTSQTFANAYQEVIGRIQELQPDAVIYIQSIMHVTHSKSISERSINNTNIDIRNDALKALADDRRVFYLDMNEAVDNDSGEMREELSFDGVHLKAKSYGLWYDHLKRNAVVRRLDEQYRVSAITEAEE